ncbi:hypothetical protein KY284_034447 [Solanum tuberosum]|nr:hypothetical protein KY284_034447 [Solanum tuberosum]
MAKTHAVTRKALTRTKERPPPPYSSTLTLMIYSLPPSLHPSGWAKIFFVPMVVYEPLIRLFYANLRSLKDDEIESLVLEPLASNCDVSIEQAKREIILDPSLPIPSHLRPKDLPFETRVIAHIVATTLLPRVGSHSTLSQRDTMFAYCLVSGVKVHLLSFILFAMTDVISDPSSLPFGMIITRIFESHFMCLGDFSPVLIKQRYNSRDFLSMGFTRSDSSWVLKTDADDLDDAPMKSKPSSSTSVSTTKPNAAVEGLVEMHTKLYAMAITVAQVSDLMTKLTAMSEQVDSLKDLLLSAHFKIDSVKDVTKETGLDVARIHLKLDQIVKEAIKIATKVQASSKAISTCLSSRFEEMSTGIVNTLTYFLCPR